MAAQDVLAIQRMRRHSNSDEPLSPEDPGYDCRALALFVSAVFQTSVPASLVGRIPATGRATQGSPISSYTYLRCVVRSFDDETIHATVVNQDCDEEVVTIDYRHTPDYIDFSYLTRILQDGMTLNLLDCHREDERLIRASSSSNPTICWTSPPSPPASRTTATTLCSSRSTG